jgi:hypothetical protein
MMYTEEQVEWIVAEVMRRLGAASVVADDGGAELVLKERVVTIALIEGRLAGVSRLVVPKRSVVTPAVKDELKQRKVELVIR